MVIICPIGWGMAQRGARVNIKNASCNVNVTLVRIKESWLYLVHWLFPFGFLFL